jgi:hypothetical protein
VLSHDTVRTALREVGGTSRVLLDFTVKGQPTNQPVTRVRLAISIEMLVDLNGDFLAQFCGNGTFESDPCPAGYYCPSTAEKILCPEGHFCKVGSIIPRRKFV